MSTTPALSRSSTARTRRLRREDVRERVGVTVDMINQGERDALVVRGYLSEKERDNGAALKKAVEALLSDIELDLQSETAERSRARV
jgi:hypothetical protein